MRALSPGAALPEEMRQRIAMFIRDLGHARYAERAAAAEELRSIGWRAYPLLQASDDDRDIERAVGVGHLLDEIEKTPWTPSVMELPRSPARAEGLEAQKGWTLAEWADRGSTGGVSAPEGKMLYLVTRGEAQGKSAAVLQKRLSLPSRGAARLAVYNHTDRPVKVAVAFWFSERGDYYESTGQEALPWQWQDLSFDLRAGDYKCLGSRWSHDAPLPKERRINQVMILLYAGGRPAAVLVDGIRVKK
jgi:hypothetical protein